MTPQLMQSIRLLQLTRQELDHFIDNELERNPLLEREDDNGSAGDDAPEISAAQDDNDDWLQTDIAPSSQLSDTFDAPLDNLFAIQSLVNDLDAKNRAAEIAATVSHTSDAALKRDVVRIGELASGIGLYRYRYIWSDVFYVGVIAQEVQAVRPEAVTRSANGYLKVDYGLLGIRMTTWREWQACSIYPALALAA